MKRPAKCPQCGSFELHENIFEGDNPRYGRLDCDRGHKVEWLNWPRSSVRGMPRAVAELVNTTREIPADLTGPQGIVKLATRIRWTMERTLTTTGHVHLLAMILCVEDSGWFVGNAHAHSPETLKYWPRPNQMHGYVAEASKAS